MILLLIKGSTASESENDSFIDNKIIANKGNSDFAVNKGDISKVTAVTMFY